MSPLQEHRARFRRGDEPQQCKYECQRAAGQCESHASTVAQQPRELRKFLPVAKNVRQQRRNERAGPQQQERGKCAKQLREKPSAYTRGGSYPLLRTHRRVQSLADGGERGAPKRQAADDVQLPRVMDVCKAWSEHVSHE